jgi:hypothetical protein
LTEKITKFAVGVLQVAVELADEVSGICGSGWSQGELFQGKLLDEASILHQEPFSRTEPQYSRHSPSFHSRKLKNARSPSTSLA